MKRDQIFDWTDYLNSTLTLDRWRDIFKTFKNHLLINGQNNSMQSNNSFLDLIILLIISCFLSILPFTLFSTFPWSFKLIVCHHPPTQPTYCEWVFTTHHHQKTTARQPWFRNLKKQINLWNEKLALLWACAIIGLPVRSFRTFCSYNVLTSQILSVNISIRA